MGVVRPVLILALTGAMACGSGSGSAPGSASGWRIRAAAPSERSEGASAVVGSRIVVSGGFRGDGGTVPTVEIYDAQSDSWTAGPPLPIAVNHPMSTALDGKVFVMGGYRAGGVASDRAFVLVGGAWHEVARMPEGRAAGGAAAEGGKVFVVGGVSGSGGLATVTMVFEPAANRWSMAPGMPTAREHLGVTAFGGRIYAVGGRVQFGANLGAAEAFDPATSSWSRLADMPTPRGGIAAAAATRDGLIVAIGGEDAGGTFEEVEAFVVAEDRWIALAPLPTPRHGLAVAAVKDALFAIAGGTEPGLSVSDVNESLVPRAAPGSSAP